MKPPIVSILVPMKNAASYLPAMLSSIRQQSMPYWEMIVVDDHSTDDSAAIVERWAVEDARIKLSTNLGQGIVHALRTAYRRAKGALITRMDADDIADKYKLALLSDRLSAAGVGHVAVGGVRYFSEDQLGGGYIRYANWLNQLTYREANFSERYRECCIPSPNWMLHRTDLDRIGGFEVERYPEDYDLAFRMREGGIRVAGVQAITHYWRDHAERSSRTMQVYRDQHFSAIKSYYLQRELGVDGDLVIWGAGRKAKAFVKSLPATVPLTWVTDNVRKQGHKIYGHVLASPDVLDDKRSGIFIALWVSSPAEQKEIMARCAECWPRARVYRFC